MTGQEARDDEREARRVRLVSERSCYVAGCPSPAYWLVPDEEYGDLDSCAEHAGYGEVLEAALRVPVEEGEQRGDDSR